MVPWQRLGFGHVQNGGVEAVTAKTFKQGFLIDCSAAADIAENHVFLHQLELLVANHIPRLVGQVGDDADKVALGEHLIQGAKVLGLHVLGVGPFGSIVVKNSTLKGG